MQVWHFGNNQLTGTLPPFQLSHPEIQLLDEMDISSNFFTGPIPEGIVNQTSLSIFNAANNALDLPTFLFNCTTCNFVLILSANKLSGTLPDTILGPVPGVNLAFNAFTGNVPSFIAISLLDLSYNSLSGAIPCVNATFSNTALRLDGNNLTQFPSAACVMPNIGVLSVSNCPLEELPLNMASMLPGLTTFVARNASTKRQQTPVFTSHLLQIIDISGNDFNDTFSTILSPTAQYASVAPLRDVLVPNFTVIAPNMYPVGLYIAARNTNIYPCACNSIFVLVVSAIRNTIVLVEFLYNDVNNHQVQYTFTTNDIQGVYRVTLFVVEGQRPVPMPAVDWNGTTTAIPPIPNGELIFTGLQTAVLLRKVQYSLLLTVSLSSCPSPGAAPATCPTLVIPFLYNVTAANCDPSLFGVPYTVTCAACPIGATCDGTPYITTDGVGLWRWSDTVLPLASSRLVDVAR